MKKKNKIIFKKIKIKKSPPLKKKKIIFFDVGTRECNPDLARSRAILRDQSRSINW